MAEAEAAPIALLSAEAAAAFGAGDAAGARELCGRLHTQQNGARAQPLHREKKFGGARARLTRHSPL